MIHKGYLLEKTLDDDNANLTKSKFKRAYIIIW